MTTAQIKFFYNGFKVNGGALYKVYYNDGPLMHYPQGTITIYARDDNRTYMPKEMRQLFEVENNTDSQSDYFENDRIRVLPTHKLYAEIKAACEAAKAKSQAKYGKGV